MIRTAIFAASLTLATVAAAQQSPAPLAIPQGDIGQVRAVYLAADLARHARSAKDPLAMIAAARIGKASGIAAADYEAWLKEAGALGKQDKMILAMADDVRSSATKGRTGPSSAPPDDLVIKAAATNLHTSTLEPGERVELALVAEEGLAMIVRGPDGSVLCRSGAPGYCAFLAASAETHTVEVRNARGQPAQYRLVVRRTPPMKAELKQ